VRVSKEDSADLDFVIHCLMTGAINLSELRSWCDHLIGEMDEVPDWMFDLAYFDGPEFHIYRIIGFYPHGSNANPDAVAGIALKRGREIDMYEHSYHMDYGSAAVRYIDAFMRNVNWEEVERRHARTRRMAQN
jgi:hypothetical protein